MIFINLNITITNYYNNSAHSATMGDVNSKDYDRSKDPYQYLLYYQEMQNRQLEKDKMNGVLPIQTVLGFMKAGCNSAPGVGRRSAEVDKEAFEKSVSAIRKIRELRKQKTT